MVLGIFGIRRKIVEKEADVEEEAMIDDRIAESKSEQRKFAEVVSEVREQRAKSKRGRFGAKVKRGFAAIGEEFRKRDDPKELAKRVKVLKQKKKIAKLKGDISRLSSRGSVRVAGRDRGSSSPFGFEGSGVASVGGTGFGLFTASTPRTQAATLKKITRRRKSKTKRSKTRKGSKGQKITFTIR